MKPRAQTIDRKPRDERKYVLGRGQGLGAWELTFEGQQACFKHQPGVLYVAWLLLHPPPDPIHAVALALDARTLSDQTPGSGLQREDESPP